MASYQPPENLVPIYNVEEYLQASELLTQETGDSRYLKLTGGLVTGTTIFNSNIETLITSVGDGAETLPSLTFTDDLDSGFYKPASDELSLSLAGSNHTDFKSQGIGIIDGTPSLPSIYFKSDIDTGISLFSDGILSLCAGGDDLFNISQDRLICNRRITLPNGVSSSPSLSFGLDQTTGIYNDVETGRFKIGVGGSEVVDISASSVQISNDLGVTGNLIASLFRSQTGTVANTTSTIRTVNDNETGLVLALQTGGTSFHTWFYCRNTTTTAHAITIVSASSSYSLNLVASTGALDLTTNNSASYYLIRFS